MIDLSAARQFLSALDTGAEFTFQAFADSPTSSAKATIFNGTFDRWGKRLSVMNANGAGVFVTVNRTDLKGRKEENIRGVRAVFLDLDGAALPESWPLEPHLIVQTSPGKWHVYWRVSNFPLDQFTSTQKAIADKFGGDPAVHDLGRVMRLPGFYHQKKDPFLVTIIRDWSADLPYPAEQILSTFPFTEIKKELFMGRAEAPDPMLTLLTNRGMVLGRSTGPEKGMYRIICPWAHTHTNGNQEAAYFLPHYGGFFSGGFRCLHAHCVNRRIIDLKEFLNYQSEGDKIAVELLANARKVEIEKIERKRETPEIISPDSILPQRGLIRDIADYILETSVYPQPVLAVAAATVFVGCLLGGKIASPTGLRSNLYAIALAQSGTGKEHAQKIIRKLAGEAGLDRHLGADSIASGTAVFSALSYEKRHLYLLDEFGLFLKTIMDGKNQHKAEIMKNFMTAYSRSDSSWLGTDYADKKEKPRIPILNPHLCLYGISTHSTFFDALSSSNGGDGSIARMIFFDLGEKQPRPKKHKGILFPPPPALIEQIKACAVIDQCGGNLNPPPTILTFDPDVDDQIEKLDLFLQSTLGPSDAVRAIHNREVENTIKLAITHAASCDSDTVTLESFEWATSICRWSSQMIVSQLDRHVADNLQENHVKRVLRIIEDESAGISHEALTQKTRILNRRERESILADLLESGDIILQTCKKNEGGGRPKKIYIRC